MLAAPKRTSDDRQRSDRARHEMLSGKAASRSANNGPDNRSVGPVPPNRGGKSPRDRHARDRPRARRQKNEGELGVAEAEHRLHLRDRHRPGADPEAIGEKDRGDAYAGAQQAPPFGRVFGHDNTHPVEIRLSTGDAPGRRRRARDAGLLRFTLSDGPPSSRQLADRLQLADKLAKRSAIAMPPCRARRR